MERSVDRAKHWHQRGKERYAQLSIPFDAFLAHLQSIHALGTDEIHAEDLYLACACLRGDAAALELREAPLISALRGTRSDAPDELLQQLRGQRVRSLFVNAQKFRRI